jgi:quercetin dioxygenase-like cupin family protein
MRITKLISIIALCWLSVACNQTQKPTEIDPLAYQMDTTEIDVIKTSPDKAKVLLENKFVRVVEYSLKPGEKDSTHTHPPKTSYVISGGTLRVYPENEKPFDAEEVKGSAEWADKIGKHYVENIGTTTVTIVLTEIKSAKN